MEVLQRQVSVDVGRVGDVERDEVGVSRRAEAQQRVRDDRSSAQVQTLQAGQVLDS